MTTTSAVPSSDPTDLLFNAQKIDEAVNSSALVYTDRLGVSRLTLAGAMARISAVNPRGAWATGTAYAARDLVLNSGTWYISLDAHISGATFAGDQSAHWRVFQGVTSADLADATSVSKGAGLVGFFQSGTGAAARTALDKLREAVSVTDFGANGDGTGDLGAILQKAHDALPASGGVIRIPAASSYYLHTTTAAFTKPILLVGDGWYSSVIYSTTNALVYVTTTAWLKVQNLCWQAYGSARTTAVFIKTLSAASSHGHTTLRDNYFDGGDRCYYSQSSNAIVLDGNVIAAQGTAGVYLENNSSSDIGDSFITNNSFSGGASTIGVIVASTSGLYITNNKFNNEQSHILISHGANNVGDFTIQGNSFEGHSGYAIKSIGTSGVNTKTLITGNQFSAGSTYHIDLAQGAQNVTVTGNTFNSTSSASGIAILIEAGAKNITLTGNAFHQILTAISAATSNAAGITMWGNRFADDVTNLFSGDDGLSTPSAVKELAFSRFVSNNTPATYTDAVKVKGYGVVEVYIYGTVQGVGSTVYARKVLLNDSAATDIDAAVTAGATIDVQLAASGGYLVVSTRQHTATGTSETVYVEVRARGMITGFLKA